MHPDLLVKVLGAIEPENIITVDRFQEACGISSKSVTKSMLDYLEANNIGSVSKNVVKFSGTDRISAAVLALQMGCDIEQVSRYLSWKDFEKLASELLISFGLVQLVLQLQLTASTGIEVTSPRYQNFPKSRSQELRG